MNHKRKFTFTILSKELAYLIGVYLGDGCVSKGHPYKRYYRFTLEAIDLDFINKVKDSVEKTIGPIPIIRTHKPRGYGKKDVHRLRFGSVEMCEWLVAITANKTKVPDIIPKNKCDITKSFCEGFLDSEGYVAKNKKPTKYFTMAYQVGFGCCSLFIKDIVELLKLQGVIVNKCHEVILDNGSKFYKYTFNIKSVLEANIIFAAKRKSDRLQMYKEEYVKWPSETMHQTPTGDDIVQTA